MKEIFVTRAATRRIIAALLALCLVYVPVSADAQGLFAGKKSWVYALVGAAIVGIPAYFITNASTVNDNCSSRSCVTLVGVALGAGVGFLIGRELDHKYNRRMAAGPSLKYNFDNVPLDLVPDRMSWFPGGAAVIGLGGARIVMRDGSVISRAFGVRGIEDAAVLPDLELLVLSTASSLLAFPVASDSGQGQVIDERGGSSMEVFDERLVVAGLDSLRLLALVKTADGTSVETLAGLENFDFITDMAFSAYARTGWVLIEDRLVAYSSDLEKVGEMTLPAAGRSVRTDGNRLAVAAGSHGVYILEAADPAAARVVQEYTGLRFAYAADLDGDVLYVAGGSEGVVVLDIGNSEPRVIGVAREVEFASDVVIGSDGEAWILDREGRKVQIADFAAARSRATN